MIRKTALFLSVFFVAVIFNFFLISKLKAKVEDTSSVQTILLEIESSSQTGELSEYRGNGYVAETTVSDGRVANLKAFFRKYNSPLYDHAKKIVEESDRYKFDYRLLAAIAMQESTLCKKIPHDSYNCWGWGIYGDLVTRFTSYDEGIEVVSKGIKKEYIDKGLVTASSIMKKYTPSSNGSWARGVNTVLKWME